MFWCCDVFGVPLPVYGPAGGALGTGRALPVRRGGGGGGGRAVVGENMLRCMEKRVIIVLFCIQADALQRCNCLYK